MPFTLNRRQALIGLGAATLASQARIGFAQTPAAPISIVINQSPWLASFSATVDLYQKETGNKVNLEVVPFDGMLEKQRNSVRASQGDYDILILNSGWFVEMYYGGFVTPITEIDPGFTLDPGIFTLGDTIYFDAEKKNMTPEGKLMTLPIQPNIPMLYYRGDLYQEKGLKVPETFEELFNNAKALQNPPQMYGIVQRGARGANTVSYDFYPYLFGMGGAVFKDQTAGDYSVVLNDDKGKAALDYYLNLAKEAGHPKTASQDQAQIVQALVTGHCAHASLVIAAYSTMDDPKQSAVVDKIEYAPTPHAPGLQPGPALGHWLGGVAHNVPDDRKRAAVAFLSWFQTRDAQIANLKAGGIPLNATVYEDPLADERQNRWMKPLAAALPHAINPYAFPEATEVVAVLELGLNRAIAGEITAVDALNSMSDDIYKIMEKYKYKTAELPKLTA
jgi:multiple sugar transport system substrate-binding protein